MLRPLLSVIIPSYNRPQHLSPLLDSIVAQEMDDWEVVIAEDFSPSRERVRAIANEYAARFPEGKIRCHLNEETLGYDRNLRRLVELARGRYVFIMGDDDFVAPGAFAAVAAAIDRHPDLGLLLRAFSWFVGTPDNVVQVTRYYPHECVFPAGQRAILACYRRLVVMSGLVMHRDLAQACATDRWDGSLFYQHWMAANILAQREAVYIPDILVNFRRGSPRAFGTAKTEQGLYTPGEEPPDTSLKAIRYQFAIAQAVETERGIPLMGALRRDYANYIFPALQSQAHRPWKEFHAYYRELGRMGLDRFVAFHAWFWLVAALGARRVDSVLQLVRRRMGHTPNLSRTARPAGA